MEPIQELLAHDNPIMDKAERKGSRLAFSFVVVAAIALAGLAIARTSGTPTTAQAIPDSAPAPSPMVLEAPSVVPEAPEDVFGEEWTTKPGQRPDRGFDHARSAVYHSDDGAVMSVVTKGGTFGFPDLEKVQVGAVEAWVIEDPGSSDITYITASGNGGTTHLRLAGLDQEQAIMVAAKLFTTEATTFADIGGGGSIVGDHLPATVGEFGIIGDVVSAFSSLDPSRSLTLVNNQSAKEASLSFYDGSSSIAVAQAELLLTGARVDVDGTYVIEATEYRKATVGRYTNDGQFVVVSSDQLDLRTLTALSEEA